MNILITGLYGFTIAFASILYAMIVLPEKALTVALYSPLIVSAAVIVLSVLDWAISRLSKWVRA